MFLSLILETVLALVTKGTAAISEKKATDQMRVLNYFSTSRTLPFTNLEPGNSRGLGQQGYSKGPQRMSKDRKHKPAVLIPSALHPHLYKPDTKVVILTLSPSEDLSLTLTLRRHNYLLSI